MNDETIAEIKRKLKGRRSNLQGISNHYFEHLQKFQMVKGTDKDGWFEVERLPNGETSVTGYRIKKGKKQISFTRKYTKENTPKKYGSMDWMMMTPL